METTPVAGVGELDGESVHGKNLTLPSKALTGPPYVPGFGGRKESPLRGPSLYLRKKRGLWSVAGNCVPAANYGASMFDFAPGCMFGFFPTFIFF